MSGCALARKVYVAKATALGARVLQAILFLVLYTVLYGFVLVWFCICMVLYLCGFVFVWFCICVVLYLCGLYLCGLYLYGFVFVWFCICMVLYLYGFILFFYCDHVSGVPAIQQGIADEAILTYYEM